MQGRSSIKRDADAVLKALSDFEERPDDPQRGQHTRSTEELHRSSFKEWSVPRLNDAVTLLLKRNLVEADDSTGSGPFEMNTLTLTVEGRIAFEEMTAAHAAREMNGFARRLLNYLHAYYVKSAGRPFGIYPNEETRAATGLSGELYMQAAHRLIHGGLARWMSNGGHLTITPAGVRLAEQAAQLERVFPIRREHEDGPVEGLVLTPSVHIGELNVHSKNNTNVSHSTVGAIATGDGAVAHGEVSQQQPLTQQEFERIVSLAQRGLVSDQEVLDRIDQSLYEDMGHLIRLLRKVQILQGDLASQMASMKSSIDDIWSSENANKIRSKLPQEGLEVLKALGTHVVTGIAVHALMGK